LQLQLAATTLLCRRWVGHRWRWSLCDMRRVWSIYDAVIWFHAVIVDARWTLWRCQRSPISASSSILY